MLAIFNCNDVKDIPNIQLLSNYPIDEIQEAFVKVKEILAKRDWDNLVNGRFSWLFIIHLIEHKLLGESINFIINEIEHLEDPDKYKNSFRSGAETFKHKPLAGLKKKHYGTGNYLEFKKNVVDPILDKESNRLTKKAEAEINTTFNKFRKSRKNDHSAAIETFIELTFGKMIKKSENGTLTGEWIILHTYNGENYYLALCKHEPKDSHQELADLIKMFCKVEFPQFSNSIELFDFR